MVAKPQSPPGCAGLIDADYWRRAMPYMSAHSIPASVEKSEIPLRIRSGNGAQLMTKFAALGAC
jgi:hypothetical protein